MTVSIDGIVSMDEPVQAQVLYFPCGNDVTVTVRYPGVADGTGAQSEFYYKADRKTSDTDPSTTVYASPVVDDPDNAGATMSRFIIDDGDNSNAGAFWWRIDFVGPDDARTTVGYGTLMVEAV